MSGLEERLARARAAMTPAVQARLGDLRAWTPEAIEAHGLGWERGRVVLSVRDATGDLVALERYEPDTARRNGSPKMLAAAGADRDLFPPPETLPEQADTVWLVEGAPDCVRLSSIGLDAVAVPGTQGWRPEWAPRFTHRSLVVCLDADAQGRQAAQRIACDLAAAGIDVRVVDLAPHRDDGYDLTDALHGAAVDATLMAQARRWLDDVAERTPAFTPPPPNEASDEAATASRAELKVLTAAQMCALPDPPLDDQLLGPLVVRGYRTLLAASTGEGKTTLGLAMLAAIVQRRELLGWTGAGGRALVVDLEQGLRTVKRRLREAGLDDCDLVDYVRVPGGLALDRDAGHVAALEELLAGGAYDVLLLDPYYKLAGVDSNDERAVVDLMLRLDRWRDEHGFALILPAHIRKRLDPKAKLTIDDVFGSSALVRGAEVVLGLQRIANGYSRLYFLKDRDGDDEDLPLGEHWGLLFDREHGFRRDPNELAPARDLPAEIEAWLLEHPGSTTNEVTSGVGAGRGRVSEILKSDERFTFEPGPNKARIWVARGAEYHRGHLFAAEGESGGPTGAAPFRGQPDGATRPLGGTEPPGHPPADEDEHRDFDPIELDEGTL